MAYQRGFGKDGNSSRSSRHELNGVLWRLILFAGTLRRLHSPKSGWSSLRP